MSNTVIAATLVGKTRDRGLADKPNVQTTHLILGEDGIPLMFLGFEVTEVHELSDRRVETRYFRRWYVDELRFEFEKLNDSGSGSPFGFTDLMN